MKNISLNLTLIMSILAQLSANSDLQSTSLAITTSNQSSETTANIISDVIVITAEQIVESGALSLTDLLSQVSGISVTNNGGLGQQSSIFMRGQSSGNILVLLDGMRLNDPSSTDGRATLEHLMLDNIAQIEIIKGANSSIWGSNASAGVINIITKQSAKKGINGDISIGSGSYGTKNIHTLVAYGDEKFTAQIAASYIYSDSFSALAPRDAESDQYQNTTTNLKVGYSFTNNSKIDFAYYHIDADGNYDDSFSQKKANDNYSNYNAKQENMQLRYQYQSGNFESTNRLSQGKFDRNYFTNSSGMALNQYSSTIQEISSINSYRYHNGKVVVGLEGKDIDGLNNYISDYPSMPSESHYQNRAIFLSNSYNFFGSSILETNIRYDDFDAFQNKTTYKVGVKHDCVALNRVVLRANYYTSYNSPSAYQLANSAIGALLKPSYTKGYDISVSYKEYFALTYFDTKVDDAIDYDMQNFGYYNVGGEEKYRGIELLGKFKLSSLGVVLSANYTHLIDYEAHDLTKLSNRAKDVANIFVDYFATNGMHFGLNGQYIGDRVDVSQESTGNYMLLNSNFDTTIAKNTKLFINVKNIFNEEYQSIYGYATEGRAIYAKINYSF